MGILKKLFHKRKESEEKETECWYNNYHEKEKEKWVEPEEGNALCSPNQVYYTTAQQAAKHQG